MGKNIRPQLLLSNITGKVYRSGGGDIGLEEEPRLNGRNNRDDDRTGNRDVFYGVLRLSAAARPAHCRLCLAPYWFLLYRALWLLRWLVRCLP